MRILFFMRHQGYVRNFESTLDELARRGHQVHLAFHGMVDTAVGRPTLECTRGLAARHAGITYGPAPECGADGWERLCGTARKSLDWLFYLQPALQGAEKPKARVERRVPRPVLAAGRVAARSGRVRQALTGVLGAIERLEPVRPEYSSFIGQQRPDLVLVTPLLGGGSAQLGYLRAALALGIRTGLCVSSWDNLTSKGLVHEVPDLVTVWNEFQVEEAVSLHGLPPDRMVATGAQAYDHWFEAAPSLAREEFCARAGLDPQRPFVVYMCSSGFIGGEEADHVERWIAWLRGRPEPALREAGVLVRPHPANAPQWADRDLSAHGNVVLWGLEDTEPATEAAKREFYDTVHHSSAVVGLNSTALIESAIIGRPVLTLLTHEYAASQEGTPHFHMIAGDRGMLVVARSWAEHAEQLAAAIADPAYAEDRRRRFVRDFARPYGVEADGTGRLVEELEALVARPAPAPRKATVAGRVGRLAMAPVVNLPELPSRKERARLRKRWVRRVTRARKRRARARRQRGRRQRSRARNA